MNTGFRGIQNIKYTSTQIKVTFEIFPSKEKKLP